MTSTTSKLSSPESITKAVIGNVKALSFDEYFVASFHSFFVKKKELKMFKIDPAFSTHMPIFNHPVIPS